MIDYIKKANKLVLYTALMIVVYVILILMSLLFNKEKIEYSFKNYEYKKTEIKEETDNYSINVSYPRYKNEKMSSIITDFLYKYIASFKEECKDLKTDEKNELVINYELQYLENDYVNIFFDIKNSLKPKDKYKSFLVNENSKKEIFLSDVYGENIIDEIKETYKKKYSSLIFDNLDELNLKDFAYDIKTDYINIWIDKNNIKENILYDIVITKVLNTEYVKPVYNEENKKYIAFTFDDGPSEYTKSLVDALAMNDSSATFFMIGNKMKASEEIIKYAIDNNMEIGSHSYSHKYLSKLSKEEMLEEINSTNIVFNEITNKNILLLRPPYGSVNEEVENNSPLPLVTWSIDPYDWLHKDSEYIKNHIIQTAYDGAIVLMHDIYPTSIEAVKLLLPELKNKGYEIVSVSKLANIKGKILQNGEIVKEIK